MMNCCSRLTASNLLVHTLPRSKSVLIMPSVADFDRSSIPDAGETSHDSTAQDQIYQYGGSCHPCSGGRNRRFSFPD
jgi:hypothetical protein